MASKPVVKVRGIERLHEARRLIEGGDCRKAALLINDFCWDNATFQGEAGEDWSTLKLAALRLLTATAQSAQKIIGEVWGRVMPYIEPI